MSYVIDSDGEQTWIACLDCGYRSFNENDIISKYCAHCHKFHEPIPMPIVNNQINAKAQTAGDPDRQKKIIVALFLILGKALRELPAHKRDIKVTEEEIRDAWIQQRSPVRLVSAVEDWVINPQRVFRTVLADLDLQKTGMFAAGEKYPEFKEPVADDPHKKELERKRVFDLE